ncbi:MAG: Nramp family divalent metal transporter [Opitutales bacterium]
MIKLSFKEIGPGPIIAAAFVGPGTVTLCTLSGSQFGYALLWAMALSIFATITLQEMSARLGIVTQKGLAEIINKEIGNPALKGLTVLLILSAIVVGNAAYEAGNISGGALGLEAVFGEKTYELGGFRINPFSIAIGAIAFALLYIGSYKALEKTLISLVLVMSAAFIITAAIAKPDIVAIAKGIFAPSLPQGSLLTVVGLIGTTVVPYNLFLHSSLAKEKWSKNSDLKQARKDTIIAVALGGVVSMCIVVSAAAIGQETIDSVSDLALGLEPLFGRFAKYALAVGLFAAGITSAITAPLAAAYVAAGCLGWKTDLKSRNFRFTWMLILALGVLSSSSGLKSIEIIKFAQIANGLLLPVVAGVLVWMSNKQSILGIHRNSLGQNACAIAILAIAIFLGAKSILMVLGLY